MTNQEIRNYVSFCRKNLGFSPVDSIELYEYLTDTEDDDFEAGGYRFIHKDAIDKIMEDELSGDTYMLGCFTDWFLADLLDMPLRFIEKLQEAEAYDAIGELILAKGLMPELVESYVSSDGYGHHFNSYDGSEYEFGNYYMFRR